MLKLSQQTTSRQQGDIGLGMAIAWFVKNDYVVSIPLTDSQDYDLVIEINTCFYAVQVRTTYYEKYPGIYQLNLRVTGGNQSGAGKSKPFDPEKVAYLFAVTDAGEQFLIPSHAIEARRSLNLGEKYAQYKVK